MIDISIIIPVFNVEQYIEQCINSIQTKLNIEIIVVDDGSTDNSKKIVEKLAQNDPRIILMTQKNKGVSEARNLALSIIKGKYTYFIDPDDYLEPNAIDEFYRTAESTNSDIIICGYKLVYDDVVGKDTEIFPNIFSSTVNTFSGTEITVEFLKGNLMGYLWNKFFKTNKIKELDLKFDSGRYSQDWYPVFKQIINAQSITFLNHSLYNYRQRSTSTVYKKSKKIIEDYIYATNKIINEIEINNYDILPNVIETYKLIVYRNVINEYTKIVKYDENFYKNFYKEYKEFKNVKIRGIICNRYLKIKTKLSLISFKIRIRHLLIRNN